MPVVETATILVKVGMMIGSKPGLTVHVAPAVFLTVVGPVPLRLAVLLARNLLLMGRLSPVLPRLILIGRPLLLLLLLLLSLCLLPFLFRRLGCFLFFRRFGLLLVLRFGFCSLILLSVCGGQDSEKEGQSPRADKPDWFHRLFLHCHDLAGHSLPNVARGGCFPLSTVVDRRISFPSFVPVHFLSDAIAGERMTLHSYVRESGLNSIRPLGGPSVPCGAAPMLVKIAQPKEGLYIVYG